MFNHGNAQGTVAIYQSVSEKLMREGSLTASASAWKLRYALDDVNDSLHGNGQMQSSRQMSR